MKKLSFFLITMMSLLLFNGCFGGSDDNLTAGSADPNFDIYDHAEFAMLLPKNWEIVEAYDFTSNMPQETVVGFVNNIKSEVFTANVNVGKEVLTEAISSSDFGKSSVLNAKKRLVSFEEIAKTPITLNIDDQEIETFISEFQGQKSCSEPIVRFKQLYAINGTNAYTVTAAFLPSEDESVVNYINEMLNSFSLK